ncbi:MAG: LacI family DNA-binding transcriptional regulator [Vallitaleaceae bacterium]|jgi:DNA-binding LacI/PurR family transcriptional regulator|nr:LacI family DNA-binding transcriptional regulator [Vallitaleaceae bacterium]
MATIKQVAALANVSTATVSRVLNGNYPVSKEAFDHVMDAVEQLGYRTNQIAKSLKMNKTFMIGLVVPDISNPYFMEIARGIEQVVSRYGYSLIFCSTDEEPEKELRLLRLLNEKRVDFVVLASSLKEADLLQQLIDQGLNIIVVDTYLPNLKVDFVVEDNENLSYKIVDYAISQGHTKIGIVNGIMDISTAKERNSGYLKALEDHQISFEERYSVNGGYYRDIAYQNVKQMIQRNRHDLPTMIYATNNQMTEGAMIAIREAGLRIPEDISIISYGDITLPQLVEPRITAIQQNSRVMGEKAGEILINRLENKRSIIESDIYVISSDLIVRNSVRRLT